MELCLQVVNASIVFILFIAFTTRNYSSIILYFAIALHFAFVCFIFSAVNIDPLSVICGIGKPAAVLCILRDLFPVIFYALKIIVLK